MVSLWRKGFKVKRIIIIIKKKTKNFINFYGSNSNKSCRLARKEQKNKSKN